LGPALVTYLSTEHRLQLVKEGPSPSNERQRDSLSQELYYAGHEVELKVRRMVQEAFDQQEIGLDFSSLQSCAGTQIATYSAPWSSGVV
jgi:hypothetical protein